MDFYLISKKLNDFYQLLSNVIWCLQNSDRIGSDWINKTWIGLHPIDKTRTGSEKNWIAINFCQNSHVTSHDQVLAQKHDCLSSQLSAISSQH